MILNYKKFRAAVKRKPFIEDGDSVLVAVSGGCDSMVLATLLVELQADIDFPLSVAHVNYKMRGEESDAQEKLVEQFCEMHRLGFYVATPDLSLQNGEENFQQSARVFRYHFLREIAISCGANRVAVAHQREDQIETILAHWLRGSSLKGLKGMLSERKLHNGVEVSVEDPTLIRPLIGFSRDVVRTYAVEENVSFIEDSSNCSPKYWRNRLRMELLPVLEDLRPKALEKIIQFGEEMGELARYLSDKAAHWVGEYTRQDEEQFWLPRPRLIKLPRPLRLEILSHSLEKWRGGCQNLKRDQLLKCEHLIQSEEVQGYYNLPDNVRFVRSGEDLLFEEKLHS